MKLLLLLSASFMLADAWYKEPTVSVQAGILTNMGCWKDAKHRAMPHHLGTFKTHDSVARCAKLVARRGYKVFGVQYGGECWTHRNPRAYMRYGIQSTCKADGRGGGWGNQVYLIHKLYHNLGCWKDTHRRAIPSADYYIGGHYQWRMNAIQKCAAVARSHGNRIFAIQHGGWCATSRNAARTYRKYGRSKHCRPGGKGGPWANQVYKIRSNCEKKYLLKNLGCWKDTGHRAIPTVDHMLQMYGPYRYRIDALGKCAHLAMKLGHDTFAVQHSGWCATSAHARFTFMKYGRSNKCGRDGEGGPWANQVYQIVCRH